MTSVPDSSRVTRVVFLCVNYHNEGDTAAFVNSVMSQEPNDLSSVVVIDNNEGTQPHETLRQLADSSNQVMVLSPGRNLGYFGAAAWGLERFLQLASLPDWVIVANTDMLFPGTDFLARLFSLHSDAPPAVIAPAIYSTVTGVNQNPHLVRRPSRTRSRFYTWVYRYYPTFVVYGAVALVRATVRRWWTVALRKQKRDSGKPHAIYAPQGSFIIFNRRYFECGGDLEHGAFLFAEEITVAEKAKRLGLEVVYDPRLEVHHRAHATTGLFRSRRLARYQWEASVFCYKEYFR